MKRTICLLLSLQWVLLAHAQLDTVRVLFLGNSYTAYNDLPGVLAEVAASLGVTLEATANTPGGATLQGHLSNATSISLIEQGVWDYVVLQEQSQLPSFPDNQVLVDFFPAVQSLVGEIRIHNPCAIPLLFMTWGRENGDASNCANWPPVCTYEGMQELLTERYLEAADLTDAWCAPVGMVWQDIRENTDLDLYQADGSHPTAEGTYIAASTLALAITGLDPAASEFDGNIAASDRELIDQSVGSIWQNQQAVWRQYDWLDFHVFVEPQTDGALIQVNASPYVDSVVVDAGFAAWTLQDGESQWVLFNDSITLTSTAYSSCGSPNVLTQSISTTGVEDLTAQRLTPFPNPSSGEVTLDWEEGICSVALFNLKGELLVEKHHLASPFVLDASHLPGGIYVVKILDSRGVVETVPLVLQD